MEGIGTHILFTGDSRFRDDFRSLRMAVSGGMPPAGLDETGRQAVGILEKYAVQSCHADHRRAEEVRKIVAMLNQTVTALSAGSTRSVERLHRIERDIQQASVLDDLLSLKARLADCLAYVQEETSRERKEIGKMMAALETGLVQAREMSAMMHSGLPGREEA